MCCCLLLAICESHETHCRCVFIIPDLMRYFINSQIFEWDLRTQPYYFNKITCGWGFRIIICVIWCWCFFPLSLYLSPSCSIAIESVRCATLENLCVARSLNSFLNRWTIACYNVWLLRWININFSKLPWTIV